MRSAPWSLLLLGFLLGLAVAGCSSTAGGRDLTAATTVYPIEFVTAAIAGERARVVNVTPPGAEPHDVELSSDQVIDIIESDLVVHLGEGFQPAVDEALGDAQGATLDVLRASDGLDGEQDEEIDPHFWLDPLRLARAAEEIADGLVEIDPEGAADYRAAADSLAERLGDLDERFRDELEDCRSDQIVTSHEAFAYLADRYGLVQIGIAGLDPESEPSPQRIAEVADFVRDNGVTTIFFETLLPPDAAETVARETGAATSVLDPLESEPDQGDYFDAMERNLRNLGEGLGCR